MYPFVGRSSSIPNGSAIAGTCKADHEELKRHLKLVDQMLPKSTASQKFVDELKITMAAFVEHADNEEKEVRSRGRNTNMT